MKITYISRAKFGKFTAAIAAAALLAGTAAPGVLAADYTAQLTKTIDMTAAPTAALRISDINIVNAAGTAKAGEITNTYAAYGLSVVKHLSGNFANAGDEFTFTIALDDPDETPHASSVTVKTGGESADFSTITGDTVAFNADGTAEVKAGITGAFARVGREKPPAEHKKQRHVE